MAWRFTFEEVMTRAEELGAKNQPTPESGKRCKKCSRENENYPKEKMTDVRLILIDRIQNIQRWYRVEVTSTLFEPIAVVCSWGRLGTTYQRRRIIPTENQSQAETLAAQIVAKKLKRQYQPLEEY